MQADPRLELVKQHIKNGDKAAARGLLMEMIQADSNHVEALYLFTFVAKSRQEAEKVLTRILQLDPLHYRARAALNKLQERSVEQLPPQATLQTLKPQARNNRPSRLPYILIGAGLLVGLTLVGAAILLSSPPNEPDEIGQAPASATAQERPSSTPLPLVTLATVEELPPTWTPIPSLTLPPSQTPAPTWTSRPSQTQYPSLTPTIAEVAMLDLRVNTYVRLFNQYLELIAQTTNTQDPQALQDIQNTYSVLRESLLLSSYEEITETDALRYLETLMKLYDASQDYASQRESYLRELQACQQIRNSQTCQADPNISKIESEANRQAESVRWLLQDTEAALLVVSKKATATAQWENRINELRTPTQAPIILPSAVSDN